MWKLPAVNTGTKDKVEEGSPSWVKIWYSSRKGLESLLYLSVISGEGKLEKNTIVIVLNSDNNWQMTECFPSLKITFVDF